MVKGERLSILFTNFQSLEELLCIFLVGNGAVSGLLQFINSNGEYYYSRIPDVITSTLCSNRRGSSGSGGQSSSSQKIGPGVQIKQGKVKYRWDQLCFSLLNGKKALLIITVGEKLTW